MDSYVMKITCDNCNSEECYIQHNWKTGESTQLCIDCGAFNGRYVRLDENGDICRYDPSEDFIAENIVKDAIVVREPFGCFHMKYSDGTTWETSVRDEVDCWKLTAEVSLNSRVVKAFLKRYTDGRHLTQIIKKT